MTDERSQELPEKHPQPHDFYRFGMEVAWRLCGCLEKLECLVHMSKSDMLEDLATGRAVIVDSPADWRAWRDAHLENLKIDGRLPEGMARFDPEEYFREETAWHQRLAKLVLESRAASRSEADSDSSDE